MNLNVRLDKNFTTVFNKLREEYGNELAKLNGFSDQQLSYTDFIDNFVDKAVVADASIDGNANVGHKDIVSLEKKINKAKKSVDKSEQKIQKYENKTQDIIDLMLEDEQNFDDGSEPQIEFPQD